MEGVFDPKQDASHGSLAAGAAWYRKGSGDIPASFKGKSVWLDFDGIYRDAVVYVNGNEIARHPSGYIGFRVDITRVVRMGAPNEVAVHVNAH